MKIVICGSINFTYEIKEIADKLEAIGIQHEIPFTSKKILAGELAMEDFLKEKKQSGDGAFRKIQDDVIKKYYNLIKDSDGILVANFEKNGIAGYIGGNVFLEMGFAHVYDKKIFLYNPLPEYSPYIDEIKAMYDEIISGDLEKIK